MNPNFPMKVYANLQGGPEFWRINLELYITTPYK